MSRNEKQCASLLNFINSETTLPEYKDSLYFIIALRDMDKGDDYKAKDLFKIQPCFCEIKFETTVGYNDPRLRRMFLGCIANSLKGSLGVR